MLTIVIPTLNSAEGLRGSLKALMPAVMQGLIARVVITDGGSTDETAQIAENAGAIFVRAKKGRGTQLSAGAQAVADIQTDNDWLLFLHADTILQDGWEREVGAFMASQEKSHAAYFSFRFDETVWQAKMIEAGVHLRCRFLRLPYGDQALLISRKYYDQLGGYGSMPLFEDVDLVRRIKRQGKLRPLRAIARTSAARYKISGYFPRVWKNWGCLWQYYRGVSPERILEKYQ